MVTKALSDEKCDMVAVQDINHGVRHNQHMNEPRSKSKMKWFACLPSSFLSWHINLTRVLRIVRDSPNDCSTGKISRQWYTCVTQYAHVSIVQDELDYDSAHHELLHQLSHRNDYTSTTLSRVHSRGPCIPNRIRVCISYMSYGYTTKKFINFQS